MTAYYKLDHSEPGYLSQMLPRADGSWVKRSDYEADLAAARAEIERLTKLVSDSEIERYRSCGELLARADKAEAERDEALAQVAAAYEAAAQILDTHGDSAATESLGQRLCCNGHMCGCRGSTVGDYLQHLIRALTPSNAKAAYEAYGREKVREGMKRIIDRLRHEGQINPSLTYADAIEWAEYALSSGEGE